MYRTLSKRTAKMATVAGFLALMVGCAGIGNDRLRSENETTVSSKIVEGKSTKNDVRALFGSPVKTSFTDGGLEIWNFEFAQMTADAVNFIPFVNLLGSSSSGTKKELVVLFDENNVVKRFSMSESDVTARTGIFNN